MKKLLTLSLFAILVGSFASCNSDRRKSNDESTEIPKNTETMTPQSSDAKKKRPYSIFQPA